MRSIGSAKDAGECVSELRRQRGLTQQQLADLAGVSRKFVAEFEAGHDGAELARAIRLMNAAGYTIYADLVHSPLQAVVDEGAAAICDELRRGDTEFALRLLGKTVAAIAAQPSGGELLTRPAAKFPPRWGTLFCAAVGYAVRRNGTAPPAWTKTSPLPSAWFPAVPATPGYEALTRRETPDELSSLNIFLREKTLQRKSRYAEQPQAGSL